MDQFISSVGHRAHVDHIGLAVPDVAAAVALYRNLPGVEFGEPRELDGQGLIVAFAAFANLRLEFLSPTQDRSPLGDLLEDRTINDFLADFPRGGVHHICLVVDNLECATAGLVAAGGRVLGKGDPVIGADGRPIVFVDPGAASDLLIELKENAPT